MRKLHTLQDLRFAARMFRNNAGFTLTAVLTIALGIGASTGIFSVVNAVLLRQLPYDAPDRLVTLSERDVSSPGLDEISFASARAYRERSRTLESLLQYNDSGGGRLILNDGAEELRGQSVSPEFFRTLGIRAELGRVFEAGDALPGRSEYRENLQKLKGIYIDHGALEPFSHIRVTTRAFSAELASRGIPHTFEVYGGGDHESKIRERIETHVLRFFSEVLSFR